MILIILVRGFMGIIIMYVGVEYFFWKFGNYFVYLVFFILYNVFFLKILIKIVDVCYCFYLNDIY